MADEYRRLDGLKVAILVTDGFEQVELTSPKAALEEAGATTKILAPHSGVVQGVNHDVKADEFRVDMVLGQADPDDFDAVLLPGGALNADALRVVPEAQKFIRAIDAKNKPVAVICHGPWLLVSAGLVQGKTMTSYHTIRDDIRNAGANWVDNELVRDENWVSSRSPKDLPAFNKGMIGLFSEFRKGGFGAATRARPSAERPEYVS
ncbi:type 1 glutamine amidotransferase domain-containing protein [Desulfomonile tiedjei]|uniref:Intracellular protease, PfpI family n=1 Tax=Desulfomonile tiedjei (strain ATCC 49306 / DSM 6799 / DCB-1) TaxID=706587 RepID=I4CAP8_DESTA|nr:type 1 glutamine amidotransferase domain-containing protein [Desulfomonile tiedjei]AFM26639.1 intracellular protease, PfpI family [Desulfomonile tiedjei DSM 6799]